MKVIILSAGIGSRLSPLTKSVPKSMLLIDSNTTVLERTIKVINKNVDAEIIVVTGYCKEQIEKCVSNFNNCKTINNPFYRVTNSIASLWFARNEMDDDIIFINADVVVEEDLFKHMLEIKEESFVLYDSSIGMEADYKVAEKNGDVVVMSKELNKFSGEYVGITKLSKADSVKLRNKVENMVDNELFNEWYETALVDMIFTEDFKLKAIDVSKYNWTEIDNVNDLIKAKKIFSSDKKEKKRVF